MCRAVHDHLHAGRVPDAYTHLLLGGDNMDLAVARRAESKGGGGPLDPDRFGQLTYGAVIAYTLYSGCIYYMARCVDSFPRATNALMVWADVLIYSALSLPAGKSSLSLYVYDRYRLRPHGYDSTVVQVDGLAIGGGSMVVMAGPCSVESE